MEFYQQLALAEAKKEGVIPQHEEAFLKIIGLLKSECYTFKPNGMYKEQAGLTGGFTWTTLAGFASVTEFLQFKAKT